MRTLTLTPKEDIRLFTKSNNEVVCNETIILDKGEIAFVSPVPSLSDHFILINNNIIYESGINTIYAMPLIFDAYIKANTGLFFINIIKSSRLCR